MSSPTPPTVEQMNNWLLRVRAMSSLSDTLDVYNFDGFEVESRIRNELRKRRTLQGGCAYRIIRFANALRRAGHNEHAETAYSLAREMIPHEQSPSPGWKTMCEENNWPHTPVDANDY